jgi:putative ABC transport system permease protein
MRLSPRWMKLVRDLNTARGRVLMMVLALSVGVFSVGTIMSAYTILTREISRNYLGTHPASALLEMDNVDEALVAAVRQRPGISDAEASATLLARVEIKPGEWMPLLLFVVKDFNSTRINTFLPESGAWPPPEGSMLLEREALALVKTPVGSPIPVQTPNGAQRSVTVSGLVHDPGLAPAWQEQIAYGYITPATLTWLDGSSRLNTLKIIVNSSNDDQGAIERTTTELASWLGGQGYSVREIRIPPAGQHPHQRQMTAILAMMFIFSLMTLVLSSILTATLIGGLLAQQVRPIGIMKTLGARTRQISAGYLVMVGLVGLLAVLVGVPAGRAAGIGLAGVVAGLLNFTLYSLEIPAWVFVLEGLVGLLVPLLVALVPILSATRITVREAINDYGINRSSFGSNRLDVWLGKLKGIDRTLLLSLRNTFRRRSRLILTLSLLATAGGMFIASLNVRTAWEQNLMDASKDRHYDLELRLNQPADSAKLLPMLTSLPGVQRAEAWNIAPAAASRPDGLDIVHTYPDGGHGSFTLRSVPDASQLVSLTLLEGRWLQPGDSDALVLNHMALALYPGLKVGDPITLTVLGRSSTFRVVGVVREVITPASAYVSQQAFEQATALSGQSNAVRVVMTRHDSASRAALSSAIENSLQNQGIAIKMSILETRLDAAVSGHVYILIFALIVMAVLMAVVGALGLMSAMGSSVMERTREFGIMRTIGGKSRTVLRNVISEGLLIGLMSWLLAVLISLPLSALIGNLIGKMAFNLPLPLILSPGAVGTWLLVIVVGSAAASLYPAWRAAQLTVRETLAYI